jgi:pimeloyl-ACP methyl ester carboxylesterase
MAFVRFRLIIAILALAAISAAVWQLQGLRQGLLITTDHAGTIPVTVWRNAAASQPAPIVVIAHGFAGSQQLMQSFAITLAHNGYVAVTFDFPGHGHNPMPLNGGLADAAAMQRDLLDSLARVSQYALGLPGTDGRLAVVGHSMAADIVVRYASKNPAVLGTVAVSLFLPNLVSLNPRNLIIIDGALEPAMLREQAFSIIGETVQGKVAENITYGDLADGSGRRVAFARGVEHIGVLYSADTMRETLSWLNRIFQHDGDGFVALSGKWLGLLLLGLVTLAWPLSTLLPKLSSGLPVRRVRWTHLLAVGAAPAILTPLILWRLPTQFLPILLGDYLSLHFVLYGLLTAAGMWWLQRNTPVAVSALPNILSLCAAIFMVTAYSLLGIGLALNSYVFSFLPGVWRFSLIAVVFCGTLPYFLADEWLTRNWAGLRGMYTFTKLCFLVSLIIAIALNLEKLFFLIIIVPVILLLFLIYGIFSSWVYRRTGNPLVAAAANAFVFAWFIAVTFPIVGQ